VGLLYVGGRDARGITYLADADALRRQRERREVSAAMSVLR
jgi:hypothetical protein